jgi:hypothetical protein
MIAWGIGLFVVIVITPLFYHNKKYIFILTGPLTGIALPMTALSPDESQRFCEAIDRYISQFGLKLKNRDRLTFRGKLMLGVAIILVVVVILKFLTTTK